MELDKMSKYARKKYLQAQKAEEHKAALAQAWNEVNKINNPPKPKAEKKPKGEPTPPRGLINDLGDRPAQMCKLLCTAAAMLKEAYDAIAVLLRVIDVLEGKQELGDITKRREGK